MPKEQKKRRGRWSYLEDFKRSASGEMVYTGACYAYTDFAGRSRKRLLTALWACGGGALALSVAQGCLPLPEMRGYAYVLLPCLCQLISAVSVVWALIRLSANREPLREYVYTATAAVLPLRALLTAVFAAATLVGDGVYLLTHGVSRPGLSTVFLCGSAIALTLALLLRRTLRGVRWERIDTAP